MCNPAVAAVDAAKAKTFSPTTASKQCLHCHRGSDNLALAPLCSLNPLGVDFAPFKPKEGASFTMHKAPVTTLPLV